MKIPVTVAAADVREGDFLLQPEISGDGRRPQLQVLAITRKQSRIIIRTDAWNTIKLPDDQILIAREQL